MRVTITGASGFVGQALCKQLLAATDWALTLLDLNLDWASSLSAERITLVEGALQDLSVVNRAIGDGVDILFHLAALPGGAAEKDPVLSRQVNLDATLDMIELAAERSEVPRIVFTSTIAVLGAPLPDPVNDQCRITPAMTYGSHKAMVELALADMHRRGLIDAVSIRLPGIVARPAVASGLKSAFMSNLFHQLKAHQPFVSPVSPEATLWLMSVNQCVNNLVHASTLDSSLMPSTRVVTLPALRITMGSLIETVVEQCSAAQNSVSYQPENDLEAHFGTHPPLLTPAAEAAGFWHDGSIANLVESALASL